MLAQNTVLTYGVNQVFRFVEGIWLRRKSHQIRNCFRKRPILLHECAICSELPSTERERERERESERKREGEQHY